MPLQRDQLIPASRIVDLARDGGLPEPLRDLNNAFAEELSFLSAEKAAHLVAESFAAARVGDADALLLAFDQDAAYDNVNFNWFKARYTRFVYVDRIVVAPAARGRGLARALYLDLFQRAAAAGQERVVCEVNLAPPNPASDAFHAALGFLPVGEAGLPGTSPPKTVRYFCKPLALR